MKDAGDRPLSARASGRQSGLVTTPALSPSRLPRTLAAGGAPLCRRTPFFPRPASANTKSSRTSPPAAWPRCTRPSIPSAPHRRPQSAAAAMADREALGRFLRESRLAARLSYKHIVTLFEYQYDTKHDLHYLALEYIDGLDLGRHIERGPASARRRPPHSDPGYQGTQPRLHARRRPSRHQAVQLPAAHAGHKIVVKLTDLGLARCKATTTSS